jgi:hypothetical protein
LNGALESEEERIKSDAVVAYLNPLKSSDSRLGGVVVSVLATGPNGPGEGDGFLRAVKIRSTPSSRMGSKVGRPHVVRFYGM